MAPEESHRVHERLVSVGVTTGLLTVDAGHELFSGETKDDAAVQWFTEHLSEYGAANAAPLNTMFTNGVRAL